MNKTVSIFVATTILASVAAIHFWQQLYAERKLTSELRESASTSLMQTTAVPVPVSDTLSGSSAPNPVATQPPTVKEFPTGVPRVAPAEENRVNTQTAAMLQMRPAYADLANEAGFSQSDADAILQLLASGAQEAEMEARLGSAGYQRWKDYQNTKVNRQNVSDLRNLLAAANQPLSEEQVTALAATLLVERQRRTEEMRLRNYSTTDPRARLDIEEQNLRITEESQTRALSAARSYLSEQQVISIKNAMNQRNQATLQSLRARRAQLDSGGGK